MHGSIQLQSKRRQRLFQLKCAWRRFLLLDRGLLPFLSLFLRQNCSNLWLNLIRRAPRIYPRASLVRFRDVIIVASVFECSARVVLLSAAAIFSPSTIPAETFCRQNYTAYGYLKFRRVLCERTWKRSDTNFRSAFAGSVIGVATEKPEDRRVNMFTFPIFCGCLSLCGFEILYGRKNVMSLQNIRKGWQLPLGNQKQFQFITKVLQS